MDFKDQLLILAERIGKLKDSVKTEEATKTSFVLPFLQALSYDIFNPEEVTPECDCDYGTKKRRENRLYRMYGRRASYVNRV